ncbi:DUF5615 family PIN-like protein [Runella sp. MFBS21]|uniref:DUF5615 family PIN-like protein n=1 Tax=Runella sp. MFBS21 TaxID=3034018 RepID=UPI0038F7E39D
MILADENIDHSLIESIRQSGIEVYSIYELQRGTSDFSIIELSKKPPRIILTEDKDFGKWVFAHQTLAFYCFVIILQRPNKSDISYSKSYMISLSIYLASSLP